MTTIAVIDVETHCLNDEGELRVIELAAKRYLSDQPLHHSGLASWLFSPGKEHSVTARASAIHHLTNADLVGCPVFDESAWQTATIAIDYLAAHNAAFDFGVISHVAPVTHPIVCTMKCARVAWPDAPSHGLQALRYHLGLSGELPADLAPHRAAYDAVVASWLLVREMEHFGDDLARMVTISAEPSLLSKIGFGKHRGTLWKDAPRDYLRWVLSQDFDEDTHFTARHWISG